MIMSLRCSGLQAPTVGEKYIATSATGSTAVEQPMPVRLRRSAASWPLDASSTSQLSLPQLRLPVRRQSSSATGTVGRL
jgi:hypothetical protein